MILFDHNNFPFRISKTFKLKSHPYTSCLDEHQNIFPTLNQLKSLTNDVDEYLFEINNSRTTNNTCYIAEHTKAYDVRFP